MRHDHGETEHHERFPGIQLRSVGAGAGALERCGLGPRMMVVDRAELLDLEVRGDSGEGVRQEDCDEHTPEGSCHRR
jgi:hypothetical protein